MRVVIAALVLLALPTLVSAQQPADLVDDVPAVMDAAASTDAEAAPTVRLERSSPDQALGADPGETNVDGPVEAQTRDAPVEQDAAFQDLGSQPWWYLVGAIVVAGVILAVLL